MAMGTQWVVTAKGPLGLNYGSLNFVMERCGVKTAEDKDQIFYDVRVMEDAALDQLKRNK